MSLNESRHARGAGREEPADAGVRDDGWVDSLRRERLRRSVRNPGMAALMSFCIMGLGQIYAGHIDRGIILMMMHLATVLSGYSLYTRGFLYDLVTPHFGPAAIVAVAYVAGVVIILLWIYNIKDAYYRSLFSGLRDWFEVERILIPHLKDGSAGHLLGAPVPVHARLTGPTAVKNEARDEADEAMVIEVARQENAAGPNSYEKANDGPKESDSHRDQQRKKRGKRTSDKPAAAMADALEEATGVARNWRFTMGLLVIFLLIGVWMFNRQEWNLNDLKPSSTLFSVNSDGMQGPDATPRRAVTNWRIEMRQAVSFLETGSITAAIDAFEKIVKNPDAPAEAWKGLMRSYHRDERLGAYEDALVRYLKAFPADADEWVTLGKLQYDRRAYVEASRSMLKCLARDPSHLRGNYMMGAIYRELGLAEDAVPHLRKAQAGDPLNPEFNRELGAAFLESHDLKNARRHLEKALSIDQQDEPTQRLLEDVDAEERRTGMGYAGGAGYGATPWAAPAPISPGNLVETQLPPAVPAPAPPAPVATVAPATQQQMPQSALVAPSSGETPRGRSVVLYVAPGLRGGAALPDLPDTLLKTGNSLPNQGMTGYDQSRTYAGLTNPTPEIMKVKQTDSEPVASAIVPEKPLPPAAPPQPVVSVAPPVAPVPVETASPASLPEKPLPEPVKESPPVHETAAVKVPEEEPRIVTPVAQKVLPHPAPAVTKKEQEESLANAEAQPGETPSLAKKPEARATQTASRHVEGAKTSERPEPAASPLEQRRARGVNAYLRGRWEEALPELLAYLKQKEDVHVYEMVGLIFQKIGAPDDAYDASRRAAQLGMREPSFTARLGLMAAGLGKWSEGTRYLNEALGKLPHRIDLRLHLARCLRNTGQIEAARLELERVVNEPNQTYAVRRRAEQEMELLGIRVQPAVRSPTRAPAPKVPGAVGKPKPAVQTAPAKQPGSRADTRPASGSVLFPKPVKLAGPASPTASVVRKSAVPASEPGVPSRW